ncbi:MAG: GNAT family N-acetyltransferase [Ferruginibacter sp.]
MIFRKAIIQDIPQIQRVRNIVKENQLSDPALVPDSDCEIFMTVRGKGWVCELNNLIVGFSIADLKENNIWALFVDPDYEGKGIGRKLHDIMRGWYFSQTNSTVWLGTAPETRAAVFYSKAGWDRIGMHGQNKLKFEMTYNNWKQLNINKLISE